MADAAVTREELRSDEVTLIRKRLDPPPPGIRVFVDLRDLWLTLWGFGVDDPDPEESEAAQRLMLVAQTEAQRERAQRGYYGRGDR